MKKIIKENGSLVLLLTILFSIIGSVFSLINLFDIEIYAFRFFLIILSINTVSFYLLNRSSVSFLNLNKVLVSGFLLLLVYGSFFYVVANDKVLFLKEIFYWLIALLTLINILFFKYTLNNKNLKKDILVSLSLVFVLVLFFGVFEFLTYKHLDIYSPYVENLLLENYNRDISQSFFTFGNPNNLSFFLSILASLIVVFYSKSQYFIAFLVVLSAFFISILNGSKITIISNVLLLCFLLIIQIKVLKKYLLHSLIVIGTGAFVFLYTGVSKPTLEKYQDLSNNETEIINESEEDEKLIAEQAENSSVAIRTNLIRNAIDAGEYSNYIGLGPGQFSWYLDSDIKKHDTKGINNPHGFILNLYSNYGIVGVIIISIMLIYWIIQIFKKYVRKEDIAIHLLFILIIILNSNAPSSFIQLPYFWVLLGIYLLLFELSAQLKIKK